MRKIFLLVCLIFCLCFFASCNEAETPNNETESSNNGNTIEDIVAENYIKMDDTLGGIVLLPDFQEYAKVTSLGSSTVKSVTITAEKDGEIKIGIFTDIKSIPGFMTSSAVHTRDVNIYPVSAGKNTIDLNLDLLENETLYIGGTASLLCDDNGTAFSVLSDNIGDKIVISDKKLSVEADVEYHGEAKLFNNDSYKMTAFLIARKKNVPDKELPCALADSYILLGKTITSIRIPVKKLDSFEGPHYITVYKIKNTVTSNFAENCVSEYKIELNFTDLSGTEINYWYSADVSHLNISLADDETLAFGSPDDTASFAVTINDAYPEQKYITVNGTESKGCVLFDIYYRTDISKEERISTIESINEESKRDVLLGEALSGKTLSVLGDSVSVFNGCSNGDGANTTNDTIRENNGEYDGKSHGVYSINLTWWMKTVIDTNMRLLVNNSSSGDHILGGGKTRCEQLHDNTGDNAGETPNIIAVLLGFNDINWSKVTPEEYHAGYDYMIGKIKECYPDADIFMFTYYQYNFLGIEGDTEFLTPYMNKLKEVAEKYNCTVVDLHNECDVVYSDASTFTSDGIHPNIEGMAQISEVFKNSLYKKYCAG
ncbi:MAG: SGNH/GDSL hydrolase family protein [Clostridia bacterium]|nr:SGNH/GDSL hydrolase family protein [Clostridia bacterium]